MTPTRGPFAGKTDEQLLDDLAALSGRIRELEDELGYDPSHQREPDGAYQARARLFVELRGRDVSYAAMSPRADMQSETIRAVVNKQRAKAKANTNHA